MDGTMGGHFSSGVKSKARQESAIKVANEQKE
jgi:hypothetical protein